MKTKNQIDQDWRSFCESLSYQKEFNPVTTSSLKNMISKEVNALVNNSGDVEKLISGRLSKMKLMSNRLDFLTIDPFGFERIDFFEWCLS